MAKILIGIILLVVVAVGSWYLGQQSTDKSTKSTIPSTVSTPKPMAATQDKLESQAYVNSKAGLKIRSPKGWRTTTQNPEQGTQVTFSDQSDNREVTANIVVSLVPSLTKEEQDLETAVSGSKEELLRVLTHYKFIDDKKTTINGQAGHILEGTFVQGTLNLRNKMLLVINRDNLYVVTSTTSESTWNKFQDLFDASMLSLELQ